MAVQDISSISFGSNTFNLKDTSKYEKPAGGIPLTDLASQGTTNAGKFVVVGSDGKLTIAAINSAGGVSF